MSRFQDWIDANLTAIVEWRCNDASGGLVNTGSGGTNQDLTQYGSPSYRVTASNNQEADGWTVDVSSLNMGWYKFNYDGGANPFAGQTTGTFIVLTQQPATSSGVVFQMTAGSYSARTSGTSFAIRQFSGEFNIEGYSAGTEVLDMKTESPWVSVPGRITSMWVVVKESVDTLPRIYHNGLLQNYDMEFDATAANLDPTFWVGDVAAVGDESISIGGYPTSGDSGSTVSAWNEDGNNLELEHLGYYDEALTSAQVQKLFEIYWSGSTYEIPGATTRTGRNKQRRYWKNQIDGGTAPTGLAQFYDIFMADGSLSDGYAFDIRVVGTQQFANMADDADWGDIIPTTILTNTSASRYYSTMDAAGKWRGFSDSTGAGAASLSLLTAWDPQGFWNDARFLADEHYTAPTPPVGTVFNDDGTVAVGWTNSNNICGSFYWDSEIRHWVYTAGSIWNTTVPSRGIPAFGGKHVSWGTGANATRVAQATNFVAATTKGHFIGEWNASTKQIDGAALGGTAVYQAATSCFVCSNHDVVFFSHQSTNSTPASTDVASQIFAYSKSGGSWSLDAAKWNNGAAHSDQNTTTTIMNCFHEIGDDIYVGLVRTAGASYNNILHLRWNGTYYAEQSSVSILGSGSYYRSVYDIKSTPDGTRVIVGCSNAGSASGHPAVLVYSRNTTTGALTPLDTLGTPNTFTFHWSEGWEVGGDSDSNWETQNVRTIFGRPRSTMPTYPVVSRFECMASKHYVSGLDILYKFMQSSGDLRAGGWGIYNQRSSWTGTLEGSGHTFGVAGGDAGQPDPAQNKGIELNGSGGWIVSGPGNVLDANAGGTIFVCAKFTSSASTKVLVFSNASDDGNNEIHIGVNGSNQMYLEVFGAAGSLGSVTDGGGFNDGEWHIWHFGKNSLSAQIQCWVDGKFKNTTTMSADYWFDNMLPGTNCDHVGIGGEPNAAGSALSNRFVGALDYIGIGDTELTNASLAFELRKQAFAYKY